MGCRSNGNIYFLSPTYPEEVKEIIRMMKNKRSSGSDNITPTLLKETKELVSQQLSNLINKLPAEGTVTDLLKFAKITPIHKRRKAWKSKTFVRYPCYHQDL